MKTSRMNPNHKRDVKQLLDYIMAANQRFTKEIYDYYKGDLPNEIYSSLLAVICGATFKCSDADRSVYDIAKENSHPLYDFINLTLADIPGLKEAIKKAEEDTFEHYKKRGN